MTARRAAELRMDRLVAAHVKDRDNHTCQRCGGPGTDWAHIISRGMGGGSRYIRWDPLNALTLCRTCHDWNEHQRSEFNAWIDARWPGRRDLLRLKQARGERQGGPALPWGMTATERTAYASGAWLG